MLDGASKIDELVEAVANDGQPAVAMTDHGNMYGAIRFYKACKEAGVKPIIGTEFYMARHSIDDRPKQKGKKVDDFGGETETGEKMYHHITALAVDTTGYQNMMKLSSEAFIKGFYRKPRIDWDIMAQHSDGIIVTSGCLGGVVLQELLRGNVEAAEQAAGRLQDIFGKDNFFVELQDHGIPEQHRTNPQLIEIARKLDAGLVATNDSHYTHAHDHVAHDALLCIQTGAKIADTDRFRFHGSDHYVKSAREMRYLFREVPEACDNTLLIAERADIQIDFNQIRMPKFPVPDGFVDEEDYLRALVIEGAEAKYGALTSRIVDRLEYELDVICQMGFPGYFLITWDLIRHAKSTGIVVGPGRGSAGGCAVAYCLGITAVDPLKHGLLFERFLNPARVSMPDIDIDIDSRFREHMINYCAKKYGEDKVAQIITFGTIKSRQAVRDAARVLDKPFTLGDRIAKALPPLLFGRDTPLRACLTDSEKHHDGYEQAGALRAMYNSDTDVREVVDVAMGLENLRRSDGIHAAAVVISPDPLTEYTPVQQKPKGPITTQYEMHAIEDLGLLKEDFLGLTTLDVISDAAALMYDRHGIEMDLVNWDLPLDDQPTYDLLRKGDTIGVFQLEGTQMRALLRDLEPTEFEHIAAVLALYRPGPLAANMHIDYAERKTGRAPIEVFHEDAKEMLKETYGLMIYQEQLMDVAQHFAGYTLGDAYLLLKTCAKKLPDAMAKERNKFVNGVIDRGFGEEFAEMLFGMVAEFANYAFNKSHSVGYGLISYWTAYMKANYPAEYMAALMTSVQSKHEKLSIFLSECKKMGLKVEAPSINSSQRNFQPTGPDTIVCGFLGIRNVGEGPAQAIVEEREANGDYTDFFDYTTRVGSKALNKKVVEALVSSGAFDALGVPRRGLVQVYPQVQEQMKKDAKRIEKLGDLTMFDIQPEVTKIGIPDLHFDQAELLALEKEYLGVYISGHPLAEIQDILDEETDFYIHEIKEMDQDQWSRCTIAGMITNVDNKWTKKGDLMKIFRVEDQTGEIECVLFPRQTKMFGQYVEQDAVVYVNGNPEEDRNGTKILVETVKLYQRALSTSKNVHLWLPDTYPLEDIKQKIKDSHGDGPVTIRYMGRTAILPRNEYLSSVASLRKALQG